MAERGDSFREIENYMKEHLGEQDAIKLMETLKKMVKTGEIKVDRTASDRKKKMGIGVFIGFGLIGLGVFLYSYLRHSGYISTVPLVLVIAGIYGLIADN